MSIQWTFIAGYLYFEIAVVTIMMLPIFSPSRWHQFFNSRLFAKFREHAAIYFYVFLGVLSLFLVDAIREMRKYSHDGSSVHLASEMKGNVKLFRAQRNFYITGFAIFLTFVIRRLVTMFTIQDEMESRAQKIIKEAKATMELAKSRVSENNLEFKDLRNIDKFKQEIKELKNLVQMNEEKVKVLEEEANKWRLKYEAIIVKNGKGDEKDKSI